MVFRLLAPCLSCVLMVMPSSAGASQVVGEVELEDGPQIVGSQVAWAEHAPFRASDEMSKWVLRLATPGETPETIAERIETRHLGLTPGSSNSTRWAFIMSPTHLAMVSTFTVGGATGSASPTLTAGALQGPFESLYGCTTAQTAALSYDLEGSLLAYATCDQTSPRRIVLVDLAGSPAPSAIPSYTNRVLRLAGRYVGFDLGQETAGMNRNVVWDSQTNSTAYTFIADAFALREDGVAVGCFDKQLFWISPEEPFEHPLPLQLASRTPECFVGFVDGGFVLRGHSGGQAALQLVDLQGNARDLVLLGEPPSQAALPGQLGVLAGVDAEGDLLAWAEAQCSGRDIIKLRSISAGGVDTADSAGCPVSLPGRAHLPRRGRKLAVRLGCPAGCAGTLKVEGRGPRRTFLGQSDFAFGRSSRPRVVRLTIPAKTAKRIRRRGRVRARMHVQTSLPNTDVVERDRRLILRPRRRK